MIIASAKAMIARIFGSSANYIKKAELSLRLSSRQVNVYYSGRKITAAPPLAASLRSSTASWVTSIVSILNAPGFVK